MKTVQLVCLTIIGALMFNFTTAAGEAPPHIFRDPA